MKPFLEGQRGKILERIKEKDEKGVTLTLLERYVRCENLYEESKKKGDNVNAVYWKGRMYSYFEMINELENQLQ